MLQQTRVATVIPYYHRFLDRFPTLRELAEAPLDDVLEQWAGLGYYRRARALHAGARSLGPGYRMPTTVDGLLQVPGIGRYTAGAVASMAYGIDAPVVDGNVIRVLCRVFGLEGDPYGTTLKKALWAHAAALIPEGQAGDLNQAVMELGALVCKPRGPLCSQCPLEPQCTARAEGTTEELPQRRRRGPKKTLTLGLAIIRRGAPEEILVLRRPVDGLFGGMWAFPSVELVGDADPVPAVRALLPELGLQETQLRLAAPVVRQLTHRELTLIPAQARVERSPFSVPDARWVTPEALASLGMPAAFRAVVDSLEAQSC